MITYYILSNGNKLFSMRVMYVCSRTTILFYPTVVFIHLKQYFESFRLLIEVWQYCFFADNKPPVSAHHYEMICVLLCLF